MSTNSYEDAGVSIERGDAFASYVARLASPAVGPIGGFAGGLELDVSAYTHPVLLSTTDGVGTKLLVAKQLGRYDTVGIDLVAMCVNDLAVCAARPMLFLDYIACGRIENDTLQRVVDGIVAGCEQAGCRLAGGETAELPDMYGVDDLDLAGFAVGLVERDERLPKTAGIVPGDSIVGIASSGIHSNGLSLARKLIDPADRAGREALLTPTRIYVDQLLRAAPLIKAAAHITGGGLEGNLRRVLPDGCVPSLTWDWDYPAIYDRIRDAAGGTDGLPEAEMRRVFNMGVGIGMVADPSRLDELESAIGEPLMKLGSVSRE
jgi:phosphoribosylformylglycinamidine cyclo-ligase